MRTQNIIIDNEIALRSLTKPDDKIIFNAIDSNRAFLRKWLPFVDQTKKLRHTALYVNSIVDDVEKTQEVFTIWVQDEFAGLIGIKDTDYQNKKTEIGYWLVEKYTGKGIMTKAVEWLISYIFNTLELNRIQIKCGVNNEKSAAIPKRFQFQFEGIERAGERHLYNFIDLEVYSLLKEEWK